MSCHHAYGYRPGSSRFIIDIRPLGVWNCAVLMRRTVVWLTTIGVAILVALAVPVSQLRTVSVIQACCCPEPTNCHCPDHKDSGSPAPAMSACHKTERTVVSPQAPVFDPPHVVATEIHVIAVACIAPGLSSPHFAPAPRRPAAPS